jgi:phosphoribosylanthranilate isomerase
VSDIAVKVCGLRSVEDVGAAVSSGARYLGFNFFDPSPRSVTPDAARALALDVSPGVAKVALVVDASDAALDALVETVPLDMLQLHGRESPERVAEVRARYGLPVMKSLGIAGPGDLEAIDRYSTVADQLLLDAKPPEGATLPGGNGLAFDWRLLSGRETLGRPWMLAGGLTPENVGEAVRRTGAKQVDVASGVESAPGVKDAGRMAAFCAAARG